MLRGELRTIVEALLTSSASTKEVSLDAIGQAIGTRAITPVEIDAMIAALEASGRAVTSPFASPHGPDGPERGAGEDRLKAVVAAARVLAPELGRPATVAEIAARSGLALDEVRHALALLRIMQR